MKHARGAPPLLPGLRGVILCTLLHAGIVAVSLALCFAYTVIITSMFQAPPTWLLPRLVQDTDAEVDTGTIVAGLLLGAVSREAARAIANILPRRRRRVHFLHAYLVLLAVTVVAGFVAADPCRCCCQYCFSTGVTTVLIFLFFLGVVLLGLILRGEED